MAAIASLRYFFSLAFHLHQISSHHELRLTQRQDHLCGFFELFLFVVTDVGSLAFGEPVDEECLGSAPKQDYRPIAFGFSLPWPGNPLLNGLAAKVGVDQAFLGPRNSLT
jgi:hypothetical protein